MCADTRTKKDTQTLSVYNDEDGRTRYKCNHESQCVWNEWQYCQTPQDILMQLDKLPKEVEIELVPWKDVAALPLTLRGNKLWWYLNKDGEALFASMRINKKNKVFVDGLADNDPDRDGKAYFPVGINRNEPIGAISIQKWPKYRGFYGHEKIKDAKTILVVEGEKTADAAQLLFPKAAVITWRGGASNTQTGLWETTEFEDKVIYLWPDQDADEAGQVAMDKIKDLIQYGTVYMVPVKDFVPEGKKDLADGIDTETVKEALKAAVLCKKEESPFCTLNDLVAQETKLDKAFKSGWSALDGVIKFPSSGIIVMEGRKGHAKTGSAVNLATRFLQTGGKVVYCIYEFPGYRLKKRFVNILNIDYDNEEKAKTQVDGWVMDKSLLIMDKSKSMAYSNLLALLDRPEMVNRLIVLDYAQIIPIPGGEMRSKMMTLLENIADLANKYGFLVLLLSQVTPDKIDPVHDTPRDSKDIHMWAEMVIRVWNKDKKVKHALYDQVKGNYTWHILENRDGQADQLIGFSWYQGAHLEPNGTVMELGYPKKDKGDSANSSMAKSLEIIAKFVESKLYGI